VRAQPIREQYGAKRLRVQVFKCVFSNNVNNVAEGDFPQNMGKGRGASKAIVAFYLSIQSRFFIIR